MGQTVSSEEAQESRTTQNQRARAKQQGYFSDTITQISEPERRLQCQDHKSDSSSCAIRMRRNSSSEINLRRKLEIRLEINMS